MFRDVTSSPLIGPIPIEEVTTEHLLWDGEQWVHHDGVVYKGTREVITYEGLTATPDHLVWIDRQEEPIQFGLAAACGAHLIQTGDGRRAVQLGDNNKPRETMEEELESLLCADRMPGLRVSSMAAIGQSQERKIERLSGMFSNEANPNMAVSKADRSKTEMRKSKLKGLRELWWSWNKIRIRFSPGCWFISNSGIRHSPTRAGARQNRHQWGLCKGESALYNKGREPSKQAHNCIESIRAKILAIFRNYSQKKAIARIDPSANNTRCRKSCRREKKELDFDKNTTRVYDICNAGEHNRFTVSCKLVHNCGYGGGLGALKAFGADEMGLNDSDLQSIVSDWRDSNPNHRIS